MRQKKKVLLSFGLATQSTILMLDEPTNDLDIPSKKVLRQLLSNVLNKERFIIVSTHQVRDVDAMIDPILILEEGRIILNQSIQAIAEKLAFSIEQKPPDINALYSEKALGGYAVLRRNESGEETGVNLELLFNAIVYNKKMIDIFS